MSRGIASARSFLFVPGDQPHRVAKALQSGADAAIIDLEDAVRPESRPAAREVVRRVPGPAPLVLVRVNALGSDDFAPDVEAAIDGGAAGIMIPKFVPGTSTELDDALCLIEASRSAGPLPVIGLVESAAGVLGLSVPVAFPPRIVRLAFGAADLHADLRVAYRSGGIHTDLAMATLVLASAAAGLAAPLDSPHFALDDDEGLDTAVRTASDLGFGGKLCIHPKQLAAVRAGFGATAAEVSRARRILDAWSLGSDGAIRVDDELVDEAMVRRARQVVEASLLG